MVEDSGLRIVETREVLMTKKLVHGLYSHVEHKHPHVYGKICKQLLGKTCTVGRVEGRKAADQLVKVAGRKTASAECSKGSIRFLFGVHSPRLQFCNAIHRPADQKEANWNLRLFGFIE